MLAVLLSVSVVTFWRLVMFRHNPPILTRPMVCAPIVADCCNGGLFRGFRDTRVCAIVSMSSTARSLSLLISLASHCAADRALISVVAYLPPNQRRLIARAYRRRFAPLQPLVGSVLLLQNLENRKATTPDATGVCARAACAASVMAQDRILPRALPASAGFPSLLF
jgi:hypothetical protein